MMTVLIIDIDSKIPNLALKKIERFHLDRNDKVIWNDLGKKNSVDTTYVSCVFDWNKPACEAWSGSVIGGSGFDLSVNLPHEIEEIRPRINLGYTTRGCPRSCPFCIVPKKEGSPRVVGDLYDLWDGKAKDIVLLDNNILALPQHFEKICRQAQDKKLRLDFNQGLDIRFLTDPLAKMIAETSFSTDLRFAWDDVKDERHIIRGLDILKRNKCRRAMFYVLCGYNSTYDEDLYRLETLKALGQRAYCMRHRNVHGRKEYIDLAAWVNQPRFFLRMDFEYFKKCRRDRSLVPKKPCA